MEFQVEDLGPCRKRIRVTVPPEHVRREVDRQIEEINHHLQVPGFRAGHAPRRLLEKRFGTTLAREVKEKLVKEAVDRLLEEKKVEPLEPPQIDVEALELAPEQPFAFDFELLTRPSFETPPWKGMEIAVDPVEVAEEEVDRAVETLRRHEARLAPAEGPVQAGDVLVLDWEAREGDSVVDSDQGIYHRHGRGVIADFVAEGVDAELEGKEPGATARARVTVPPDDPREELRGKELDLHVTLKEVKRYVLPEVDADFLRRHDYDDEAEMREDARRRLVRTHQREREREVERDLVERLVGGIEMALPEGFVERDLEGWAGRTRIRLQMEEVDEDEIIKRIEAGRADARHGIEREMTRYFVLERIADEEGIEVTEADLQQAMQAMAAVYNRPEEEVVQTFRDPARLAQLSTQIRHSKTAHRIREEATVAERVKPRGEAAAEGGEEPPAAPGRKAKKAEKED